MIATQSPPLQNGQNPPVKRGIGSLLHDFLALGELQGQLFMHDLHTLWKGSTIALAMMLLSVVLGFASLPVALLGVAWLLSDVLNWPMWGSLLAVAGLGGLVPGVIVFMLGLRRLQSRATVLTRSTSELRENTQWFKRRLKQAFQ